MNTLVFNRLSLPNFIQIFWSLTHYNPPRKSSKILDMSNIQHAFNLQWNHSKKGWKSPTTHIGQIGSTNTKKTGWVVDTKIDTAEAESITTALPDQLLMQLCKQHLVLPANACCFSSLLLQLWQRQVQEKFLPELSVILKASLQEILDPQSAEEVLRRLSAIKSVPVNV